MRADLTKSPLSALGAVCQLAFCPRDFEGALRFWTETMGVGPFFRRGPLSFPGLLYRGKPSDISFNMAIGYWGDFQIELIEQLNDEPSIYRDWVDRGMEGVHHVCIVVDDVKAARTTCVERGYSIEQELYYEGGGAIYVDTGGGPGTLTEMAQLSPEQVKRFASYREAARNWDGSEPVRVLQ
jgi:catechol 2,3-dioxygenase-like lactoylglutathione lyase family enzyme